MVRKNWTRNESILALALYCKVPFSKIVGHNKQIIELSEKIGRTPSAVAMKMCNFARLDPEIARTGRHGLKNGSRLDEEIWNEFHQNMAYLFSEATRIMDTFDSIIFGGPVTFPAGGGRVATVTTRIGQDYFRAAVLTSYNDTCCLSGINIPGLLEASHIKPWADSDSETEQTNPTNGLCLNVLHHKAFDEGFFTIDTDYKIVISQIGRASCRERV